MEPYIQISTVPAAVDAVFDINWTKASSNKFLVFSTNALCRHDPEPRLASVIVMPVAATEICSFKVAMSFSLNLHHGCKSYLGIESRVCVNAKKISSSHKKRRVTVVYTGTSDAVSSPCR